MYEKESWKYGKSWKSGWKLCLFHRGNVFLYFWGLLQMNNQTLALNLVKAWMNVDENRSF